MKSYLLHLASLLIICIGCTIALTPKEYFIFDVPNDGPAIIHTIDATKGDIVSSMSVPQFDSVNISSSHIFYHDIEQKFYIWQELAPTDSFGEGLASNNIMVYGVVAKTAEVKTSVRVVDQIIGKSYKAVNYDYKNDKVVAFGECIYQYPNNSTNSTTLPVDPPKQEYRSCVIAVDIRSGNVSQYWMADKDYDKIMPYAGAADLSNHAAVIVYKTTKGQSVCQYVLGSNTNELHIPKTYFNGSYVAGCLNVQSSEFFYSFHAVPAQQSFYAVHYNVSVYNTSTSLVYFSESSRMAATPLLKYPKELRAPFRDSRSMPFVSHLSNINNELYQLWFNTSLAIDNEGQPSKYDFVILSNVLNQKDFRANLTVIGSADRISYAFAIGVSYDTGVSTTALVVIVVSVVLIAGGGTFGVVMCMKRRSADDFEML
jgi:hypothetical protein